jgi:hypothetical protein
MLIVAFRSAKVRYFRGAKGDYQDNYGAIGRTLDATADAAPRLGFVIRYLSFFIGLGRLLPQ